MWDQFCTLTPLPLCFKSTPLKLGDTMNCYFIGKLYEMSCTRFPYSMPIRQSSNMAAIAVLVCDWPIKNNSLKPFAQIDWNFVGSTYGRFCIKFPRLVQIGKHTWLPWEILASDWLEFFIHYYSEWAQILTAATSWQCW